MYLMASIRPTSSEPGTLLRLNSGQVGIDLSRNLLDEDDRLTDEMRAKWKYRNSRNSIPPEFRLLHALWQFLLLMNSLGALSEDVIGLGKCPLRMNEDCLDHLRGHDG